MQHSADLNESGAAGDRIQLNDSAGLCATGFASVGFSGSGGQRDGTILDQRNVEGPPWLLEDDPNQLDLTALFPFWT